jgi:hypothetical protein
VTRPAFDEADDLEERFPFGSTLEDADAAAVLDEEAAYAPVPATLRGTEPTGAGPTDACTGVVVCCPG